MVPLSEAHTLSGEITAFQIKEATLDAETMKNVRITISTEGNSTCFTRRSLFEE